MIEVPQPEGCTLASITFNCEDEAAYERACALEGAMKFGASTLHQEFVGPDKEPRHYRQHSAMVPLKSFGIEADGYAHFNAPRAYVTVSAA
jgi:hypothetical protein